MNAAQIRRIVRRAIWTTITTFILTLCLWPFSGAYALDPVRQISQYGHRSWVVGDAGLDGLVYDINQASNGYLLLASSTTIYRYNGATFRQWQPWQSIGLRFNDLTNLETTANGDVFAAASEGFVVVRNGQIHAYPKRFGTFTLLKGAHGEISLTDMNSNGDRESVCNIAGFRVSCFKPGADTSCKRGISASVGGNGDIWILSESFTVCRVRSDGAIEQFFRSRPLGGRGIILADPKSGRVWAWAQGIGKRSDLIVFDGKSWKTALPANTALGQASVSKMMVDSSGSLWIGTRSDGIFRLSGTRLTHFGQEDGLTGDAISSVFEDREGSVWIATERGVDEFYMTPITRFGRREGLSGDSASSITATSDGAVWISNEHAIDRLKNGVIESYAFGAALKRDPYSIVEHDIKDHIWITSANEIGFLKHAAITRAKLQPSALISSSYGTSRDFSGNVLVSTSQKSSAGSRGLIYLMRDGSEITAFDTPAAAGNRVVDKLVSDGRGGLWAGVYQHGAFRLQRGIWHRLPIPSSSTVTGLQPSTSGGLWVATLDGLYFVNGMVGRRFEPSILPCPALHSIITDQAGELWMQSACGIIRLDNHILDDWLNHRKVTGRPFVLDASMGAVSVNGVSPPARDMVGQLWFTTLQNILMINPRRLSYDATPPPTLIERFIANDRTYPVSSHIILPANSRQIEIDIAGTSFVNPGKMMFKYSLSSRDVNWDGNTQQHSVFFTNLGPGDYRFALTACTFSNTCSAHPAVITFHIEPTFFQTWLFYCICVLSVILAILTTYAVRINRLAIKVRGYFENRLSERERIARELHDTLLQGFQGVVLKIQAANDAVPCTHPAHAKINEALNIADNVIVEGRDRIRQLRTESRDLPDQIRQYSEDLFVGSEFLFKVVGESRSLNTGIASELALISREALANSGRHSAANHVEVTIAYERRRLGIEVRDNGRGIPNDLLERGGRENHFGLTGMRERAAKIGAQWSIHSVVDVGTVVTVLVPAKVAYSSVDSQWKSYFEIVLRRLSLFALRAKFREF